MQDEFGYRGQNIVGRGMSASTFYATFLTPAWLRYDADRLQSQAAEAAARTAGVGLPGARNSRRFAGAELWRISLRLGALNDVDYGEFVKTCSVVEPVVTSYRVRHEVLNAVVSTAEKLMTNVSGK